MNRIHRKPKCFCEFGNSNGAHFPLLLSLSLSFRFRAGAQAIYTVNRSHHDAVVKCEATNDIGIGEAHTTLNVHCKLC